METELRAFLLRCATDYVLATGRARSTLGRHAADDWRFFDNLEDPSKTFTAKKFDTVVQWFSDHWPENATWPEGVTRPAPTEVAA